MSKDNYTKAWDATWDDLNAHAWYPDENIVRFISQNYVKKFGIDNNFSYKTSKPPIALDLGCGTGRNLIMMSEMGVISYGYDLSETAINFVNKWANKKNLDINLKFGDLAELPYESNFFDFVICHGVLDHVTKDTRIHGIKEVERVLKDQGKFFVSLISKADSAYSDGQEIEKDTFLIKEGYEKNIPQAFFDLNTIDDEFQNFNIENITQNTVFTHKGRSLIGSDKHYKNDDRYYITASK